jgi:hypothetical protein
MTYMYHRIFDTRATQLVSLMKQELSTFRQHLRSSQVLIICTNCWLHTKLNSSFFNEGSIAQHINCQLNRFYMLKWVNKWLLISSNWISFFQLNRGKAKKPGMNAGSGEKLTIPASSVTPVVLLLCQKSGGTCKSWMKDVFVKLIQIAFFFLVFLKKRVCLVKYRLSLSL